MPWTALPEEAAVGSVHADRLGHGSREGVRHALVTGVPNTAVNIQGDLTPDSQFPPRPFIPAALRQSPLKCHRRDSLSPPHCNAEAQSQFAYPWKRACLGRQKSRKS